MYIRILSALRKDFLKDENIMDDSLNLYDMYLVNVHQSINLRSIIDQ